MSDQETTMTEAVATQPVSEKTLSRGLNVSKVLSMDIKTFRAYIRTNPPFSSLKRYRKELEKRLQTGDSDSEVDMKKIKAVEKAMKVAIENGHSVKRRKPGTGKRTVVKRTYCDNKNNRLKKRVGQEFEQVVWEDCEIEEVPVKLRRRKRRRKADEGGEKRTNLWIESVQQAKAELKAPAWCVLRREVNDPGDASQAVGVEVYNRAMEIMKAKKAAAAKDSTN